MRRLGTVLVKLALRLHPRPFRERYGPELLAAWADGLDALDRRGRRHEAVSLTGRTVAGIVRTALPVHLDARQRRRSLKHVRPPRGDSPMRNFLADARQTLRFVRRQPGFATLAVLTLALGIGANTAVFSVLNSVILSPLPYSQPDQLVRIYTGSTGQENQRQFLTAPDLVDLRDSSGAFASVAVTYTYREVGGDLEVGDAAPRRIRIVPVNAEYFRTLTATPLLGRTFTRDEERPGVQRVVLSHALWTSGANQDPNIVGKTIRLNGDGWEVIGVMRPSFRDVVTGDVDAWTPSNLVLAGSNSRGNHYLTAVGRLAPGVSLAQARARVNTLMTRLGTEFPNSNRERIANLVPLHEDVVGESRSTVFVLMGAAGLVLLIACLNVANLFVARSIAQSRETAIRTALGAARARLVSQRLTESILLAGAGGLVGSLVAYWGVRVLLAVSPESLARAEEIGLDPTLLLFALFLTVTTGLVFGAWPAFRASRVDPTEALHDGARGNSGGRAGRRARAMLVATQVAMAMMLLVGAGVLMRSFIARQQIDLGFDSSGVATFEVHLPITRYGTPERRVQFHDRYMDELRELPGVEVVGVTSWLPANGRYHEWGVNVLQGQETNWISAQVRVIDGDFLEAMAIPLVAGRRFGPTDRLDTEPAAIVSRALARAAFGDEEPIGKTFTLGPTFRVVGVVDDVAFESQGTRMEMLYLSHDQYAGNRNWALTYVVKGRLATGALVEPARRVLAGIDPALVLYRPRSMDGVLAGHHARARFTFLLMTVFAGVALVLAAVGVYGVLSYAVTQRTHEIGVRMALGARPAQVRAIVMGQGLALAGAGVVTGFAGAWMLSSVLSTLTFDVSPRDPLVYGTVTVVLTLVILAAGYVPARRATQVDPLDSLRGD